MSKLIELFDDFARPIYVEWVLKRGCEPHGFILVYDTHTKQASLQINIWNEENQLIEVPATYNKELFEAIMKFLRGVIFTKFSKDPELFYQEADEILIIEYLNKHIKDTFYEPELEVSVMQLDII
ncbi:hypothetical protein [Sediminibacterium sp.]|uniref:hypothetical protein n=1 Tax=Sediminibacterium sp. TaxID=1917865 RepID=UPI002736E817|nr:hypothetical protein [Sediminibacterium sp.]MDP3395008.1 hypothetical protein [Sediminibacterium sp.]MDP3565635.1 hypothetical protein [Sediminibacterium sp.]